MKRRHLLPTCLGVLETFIVVSRNKRGFIFRPLRTVTRGRSCKLSCSTSLFVGTLNTGHYVAFKLFYFKLSVSTHKITTLFLWLEHNAEYEQEKNKNIKQKSVTENVLLNQGNGGGYLLMYLVKDKIDNRNKK